MDLFENVTGRFLDSVSVACCYLLRKLPQKLGQDQSCDLRGHQVSQKCFNAPLFLLAHHGRREAAHYLQMPTKAPNFNFLARLVSEI